MDPEKKPNKYQEYSLATIKKQNAEYLTPKPIIELIHNDIGERWLDKDVIDVCCGSGGLSYGLKCKSIYGVEANPEACKVARANGYEVLEGDYFDFDWSKQKNYDCVISNPPFSLKKQDKHNAIYKKYNQKAGVLDPYFVVESFEQCSYEGYYVLFCGLLYRRVEKWWRQWMLDNNLIDKLWITQPNLFKETSIAVIIVKLKRNRDTKLVKCINSDGYESDVNIDEWIQDDYTIRIPERPKEEEVIDIDKLNEEIEKYHQQYLYRYQRQKEVIKQIELYLKGEYIPEGDKDE